MVKKTKSKTFKSYRDYLLWLKYLADSGLGIPAHSVKITLKTTTTKKKKTSKKKSSKKKR